MAAPTPSSPQEASKSTATDTKAAASTTAPKPAAPDSPKSPPTETREEAKTNENTQQEPTYSSTKSSQPYLSAKSELDQGNFESGLSIIETEIQRICSDVLPQPANELHPSLAPLYYLYGTTLLYSVEESPDPEAAMMVQQPAEGEEQGGGGGEPNDDLQIAWENLDSARAILLNLDEAKDLAQVYQRLGDLQRANGNYASAISDYEQCLRLRRQALGGFHRSIADCEYCLGMTHLLLASEKEKENEAVEDKKMSYKHYFHCGRVLAGLIAESCGEDPAKLTTIVTKSGGDEEDDESQSLSRALKEIRNRVSKLEVSDKPQAAEWKEMLDEIQETMDNSEESVKVLQDVSKLKKEQEEAAEKEEDDKKMAANTSFGFGTASSAAAASAQNVNTLMVVKKKKPRDGQDSTDLDTKKRAKSE